MRLVAIFCFFLSGASSLIFEVIWTRMFSLVFGATSLAISTVLTAFMGGLALGSFLAGKFADRLKDPLRAYALAEGGIGICALLVPLVVSSFAGFNQFLYTHLSDHYALLAAARFIASVAVMIIPTTLMGATLPLLSRFFVRTSQEHARVSLRVGVLYAINTTGAIIGTFLGGFVFLPEFGLTLTNRIAASANLFLAFVVFAAYLIERRRPVPKPVDPELAALYAEVASVPSTPVEVSPLARKAALMAFAFSGATAMIYQVLWTRVLAMNIGSSVYSFTLVLMAFLIGLAIGAAVLGRLASNARRPTLWLAFNHLAVVIGVGISYLLMDKLPFIFLFLIRGETLDAGVVMGSQFLLALLVMMPATLAMGGIFPLTIRIYSAGVERVGQDVGNAYSINTVGAIVGSFLAGFVVIPIFQIQPGLYAAVCINLIIAFVLFSLSPLAQRRKIIAAMAVVLFAVTGYFLPRWDLTNLSAGLFRLSIARDVLKTGKWENPQLVYYRDGISTTVSVDKWPGDQYSMKNNGKVDASTGDDMPTQIEVGLLPVLLHNQLSDKKPNVALIGYASGVTAGAILQYPVNRLDTVELEPAIIEASRYFDHFNNAPRKDPRLRLITDDGRNFLAAGTEKYDVIINEPSNPWLTGVSNLFTREYFEIGKQRLADNGVFCTWVQMYEIAPRRIKAIYKSFAAVFPYVYAFSSEPLSSDTFLIGTNQPLKFDVSRLRKAYAIPSVAKEMTRAHRGQPDDLFSLFLMGPDEIHAYTMGMPINTDDNALVEFSAPRDLYNHKQYDYYISKIYSQSWLYGHMSDLVQGYESNEDIAGLVHSLLSHGKYREASNFYKRVQRNAGPKSQRVGQLMDLLSPRDVAEEEFAITEEGDATLASPLTPAAIAKLAPTMREKLGHEYPLFLKRVSNKSFRSALDLIDGWPDDFCDKAVADFQLVWGFAVYKTMDFSTAVDILEPLLKQPEFVKRRPALLYYLGRAYYGNADFEKSIRTLEQWIDHRIAVSLAITPVSQLATAQLDGDTELPALAP